MSNAVFPRLPGLEWNLVKKPVFSTRIHTAASGKEIRAALWSYPQWEISLSYEFLRDDATEELQTLLGFFLQRRGAFESFLFEDEDDNQVAGQQIGTGDGETAAWQFLRTYGGFIEPVMAVKAAPAPRVYLDEVEQTGGYSLNLTTGVLTFTEAPDEGAVITADFGFYYRVRFKEDLAEFEKFMHQLWSLRELTLVTVK